MFRCRRKEVKSDASVLFIFVAAVGTLILATAVLKIAPVKRIMVEEKPPVAVVGSSSNLPEGVSEPIRKVDLELLSEPATAVAYRQGARQMIGLMQWDRRSGKNVLKSSVVLRGILNQVELPELSVERFGWGKDSEIEMRWLAADNDSELLTYVMVDGTQLSQLKIERPDGISRHELLEEGETGRGQTSLEIKDVDDDGIAELFVTTVDENGNRTVDVYLWLGDRLAWNGHWSKAMTAREGLFPEPVE